MLPVYMYQHNIHCHSLTRLILRQRLSTMIVHNDSTTKTNNKTGAEEWESRATTASSSINNESNKPTGLFWEQCQA